MPPDLGRLSIEALRARFAAAPAPVSGRLLAVLRRDPRRGARRLHDEIFRRNERLKRERARLESMLALERVLWASGVRYVAGVDEVGIGPLAGPVVAAAVVFPPEARLAGIDDSKRLDPSRRASLDREIRVAALGVGIGVAEVEEIDRVNVYEAGRLAMRRAVEALPVPAEHVLVDARTIPGLATPQTAFVKGDGFDFSIAAASIVAKVHRDRRMTELDREHPGYGFARHKGYGTAAHRAAIRRRGLCPLHRRSFPVLRELRGEMGEVYYALTRQVQEARDGDALAAVEVSCRAQADVLAGEEARRLRGQIRRRWKTL